LELKTKCKELTKKVRAQLQIAPKPRDEKQDEKKDGKDSKEEKYKEDKKDKEEKKDRKDREDKKGADGTRNDIKLGSRGSLDKKKSEGPAGGTAPKKASEEPDLFGSMFGSKDKKKPPGPPPSTMRTVPVGLF
jgi:hypothetical protein